MAKPEWGTKRFCQNCGARFYDMRRDPPTCPKCGTPFTPRAVVRPRRGTPVTAVSKTPAAAAVVEDDLVPGVEIPAFEDDVIEEVEDEGLDDADAESEPLKADAEEDALLEDASELGEDDDDMSEVMDHVNDTDPVDRS